MSKNTVKPFEIAGKRKNYIEAAFEGENSNMQKRSSLMTPAPPKKAITYKSIFALCKS